MNLESHIKTLPGVGPKIAEKLERLGIATIRDLLFYYPRRWDDFSHPRKIIDLRIGDEAIILGKIVSIKKSYTRRKWMTLIEAELNDDSGNIKAVWFNQPFLLNILKPNTTWLFKGKIQWDFKSKTKTIASSAYESEPIILPVYNETEGVNSKFLRKLVKPLLLTREASDIKECLPKKVLEEEKLVNIHVALRDIHFPENNEALNRAKERIAFDELFFIALRMLINKKELSKTRAIALVFDKELMQAFVQSLPFKLTNGQRRAAWQIINDLQKKEPMNRLVEGDVGSGKTVVAAMAAFMVAQNKCQTVWLAPTEILANQHFQNISKLFESYKIRVGLFTRSSKKTDLKKADIIIGTHALIQEGIVFKNIALLIVDEQHRFGVKQRHSLQQRTNGEQLKKIPHFLSMTATPIPRSLALAIYGDLDLSIINELPQGRQKIITKIIPPEKRTSAYDFIKKQVNAGRQAFVICPLIEDKQLESHDDRLFLVDDRKSAIKEYEKLSKEIFPHLKIGLLHGKLKAQEKEKIMSDFRQNKINILVATAVIEVGIDIPNATIIMIESAERFGLAQLHQFRGRVGRGQHQSYCLLFSESWSENTRKRLRAMAEYNNGFDLAQIDLELRGPGEIAGLRQSGLPDLKMATLTDKIMIERAREVAKKIIDKGLEKHPAILEKMDEGSRHLE